MKSNRSLLSAGPGTGCGRKCMRINFVRCGLSYRLKDKVPEEGHDAKGVLVMQNGGDNLKKRKRRAAKIGAQQKRAKAGAGGTG